MDTVEKDSMKVIMNEGEIEARIKSMMKQLRLRATDEHGQGPVILCPVMTAALPMAGAMMLWWDHMATMDDGRQIPVMLAPLYVRSYSKNTRVSDDEVEVDISAFLDLRESWLGAHVCILDTVVDSGRTMKLLNTRLCGELANDLLDVGRVMTAALIYKIHSSFKPDIIGKILYHDEYLVGFGLDDDQFHRNLSCVYAK